MGGKREFPALWKLNLVEEAKKQVLKLKVGVVFFRNLSEEGKLMQPRKAVR